MKNAHGGKRERAGNKEIPKEKHKIQVQVGIEKNVIEKWGGLRKLQNDIKRFINSKINRL